MKFFFFNIEVRNPQGPLSKDSDKNIHTFFHLHTLFNTIDFKAILSAVLKSIQDFS